MTTQEKYIELCNTKSDINEHLPTLNAYAQICPHVTELGFRWGCSTYALLAAKPQRLISYDIVYDAEVEMVKAHATIDGVDFEFINKDVLSVEIEETDLLFMDTLHHYLQLKRELAMHARKARKYIIFHDTESYATSNESMAPNVRPLLSPETVDLYDYFPKHGIMAAIEEFLAESPEWKIKERFHNNNGLLVIERV